MRIRTTKRIPNTGYIGWSCTGVGSHTIHRECKVLLGLGCMFNNYHKASFVKNNHGTNQITKYIINTLNLK